MVKEDKRYITKRKIFITHKHQELIIALKCEKLLKSVWTMIYNLTEILIKAMNRHIYKCFSNMKKCYIEITWRKSTYNYENNISSITFQILKSLSKIDNCDYNKLKCFCTTQEIINNMKRLCTEWEKILVNCISDKG